MNNKKIFIKNIENFKPPKNDTPYKRILAIGDVHGCFDKLISLWEKVSPTAEDFVIFLGDYVDRGAESAEVLKWLMQQARKKNIIVLRGNHEEMLLESARAITESEEDKEIRMIWLLSGGRETIASIKKENLNFHEILKFIKKMPLSYPMEIGGKKYFFCHAGVKEGIPLEEQTKFELLWRKGFFEYYSGETMIISGHCPVQKYFEFEGEKPRPLKVPGKNILLVDTGSYYEDGYISCVDVLTGEIWQSDAPQISATDSIIFVCAGNSCRSPMAKYIMRQLLAEKNLSDKVFVDSAGCNTWGGGSMSRRACEMLAENKIPFDNHISKQFTAQHYKNFKYLIALDKEILKIARNISSGDPEKKIRLFKNFDGEEMSVADPFDVNSKQAYQKAYKEIFIGCKSLLKELF